jgi:catechol 2,3-dioxygenase
MIRLQRLGHIALYVANLERAKDFYVGLLGCRLLEEEAQSHGRVAFLALGDLGNTLDLVESPAQPRSVEAAPGPVRTLHHLAFETATRESLRDAYFELIDRGVEVLYRVDHGTSQSIYFRDPDGHIAEIYWTPPGAQGLWEKGRTDEHRELVFER